MRAGTLATILSFPLCPVLGQQFITGQTWPESNWDYAVDLDGDGQLDLAEVTGGIRLKVAWGSAPGVWTFPAEEFPFPPSAAPGAGHDCVDWDGDGDLDFVVCNWNRDLWWVENLGSRAFLTHVDLIGQPFYSAVGLEVADVDQDGDLDIAIQEYYGGGSVQFQDLGTFTAHPLPGGDGSTSDQIQVGDLNSDGIPDITLQSENQLMVYFQSSPGAFTLGTVATDGASRVHAIVDLDYDSQPDILVDANCSGVAVAGACMNPASSGVGPLCQPAWSGQLPIVTDFNHDGLLDMVSTEFAAWSSESSLALGTGPLSFASPQPLGFTARFAVDADGDGDMDLIGSQGVLINQQVGPQWTQSTVNGHWYSMTAASSWAEAEQTAVNWGGHLATVTSQAENDWIRTTFDFDRAWIGYHDSLAEGTFEWSSGAPPGFENWGPGSPGGITADQDFVAMDNATGMWEDRFASSTFFGVVEAPPDDCNGNQIPDSYELMGDPDPTLDWDGDGLMDACDTNNFCMASPNSAATGGGRMLTDGTPVLAAQQFTLAAVDLPPFQWSHFIASRSTMSPSSLPGSQGLLCLGAPVFRLNRTAFGEVDMTAADGSRSLLVNTSAPLGGSIFSPGESWHFQLWFRDINPNLTSNTTDGISVMFR